MLVRGCGLGLAAVLLYQASYVLIGANFRTVVPGQIYRCAQLPAHQLDQVVRQYGIRTVINLRGCCEPAEWYLNQSRVLSKCQVSQEDLGCSAGRLPSTQMIQELVHVLEQTEYPILVHCHRGIDRTGLVVAVALMLHSDIDLDEALNQLTIKYAHVPFGKTGNMDRFFDLYREWLATQQFTHTRARFRDWLLHSYCPGECRAEITLLPPATRSVVLPAKQQNLVHVRCYNRSVKPWQFKPDITAGIHLQTMLLNANDQIVCTTRCGLFYATVPPGGEIDLAIPLPDLLPGQYTLRADLIDEQHASFFQTGSQPLFGEVIVK
jgi:protein tyrosine phosphatase (PTP) superfamily phosphohydrolase (DUF442 family)